MEHTKAGAEDILQQSARRRPLRNAIAAAERIFDVAEHAIVRRYVGLPGYLTLAPPLWTLPLFCWSIFGPFISLLGFAFPAPIGPIITFASLFSIPAALMYASGHIEIRQQPSFIFANSNKEFSTALTELPEGQERKRLEEFAEAAKRAFALGEVSTLQQRIAEGRDEQQNLSALYDTGLVLIDKAAKDLKMDLRECDNLKATFKAGELPRPAEYAQQLRQAWARATSDDMPPCPVRPREKEFLL